MKLRFANRMWTGLANTRAASLSAILAFGAGLGLASENSWLFAQQDAEKAASVELPPVATDTHEVFVVLADGVNVNQFAKKHGLAVARSLRSGNNFYVLSAKSVAAAKAAEAKFQGLPNVVMAANNQLVQKRLMYTPNDTFFGSNRLGGQWHLNNPLSSVDINVTGAWDDDVTGTGVVIGVVDDGLERTHPDLAPNYNAAFSFDFGQNDSDPSPVSADDIHGTSCSGLAAARGGNTIGVTGSAPLAQLAGLRIDFGASTAADFADATAYLPNNIQIKSHSYGYSAPFISDPVAGAAVLASPQTIHCYAAGNSRGLSDQDSGKHFVHNLPGVFAVAAVGDDGTFGFYSNFGANIVTCVPSDGGVNLITTTDRVGANGYNAGTSTDDYGSADGANAADYTATFGGTSACAPILSGVLALAKEANPTMDYRMANHLMVLTNAKIDLTDVTLSSDGGWRANGAGNLFNQNYGFGMIDASALVAAAGQATGVTPLMTENTGTIAVNAPISETVPQTVSFTLAGGAPLEDLLLTMNVTHTYRGDLNAFLTSPSGFRSRVFIQSGTDGVANLNWTFRTVAFWGEDPAGTWTLELIDAFGGDSGTFNSYSVLANMGELEILQFVLGDANGDGILDNGDINAFVMALLDPSGYGTAFPNIDPNVVLDIDGNGSFGNEDINGFIALLFG